MSELRFTALKKDEKRSTERVFPPNEQISDFYSDDAFTLEKMKATDYYLVALGSILLRKGLKLDRVRDSRVHIIATGRITIFITSIQWYHFDLFSWSTSMGNLSDQTYRSTIDCDCIIENCSDG